jgi:hypothetical protein
VMVATLSTRSNKIVSRSMVLPAGPMPWEPALSFPTPLIFPTPMSGLAEASEILPE